MTTLTMDNWRAQPVKRTRERHSVSDFIAVCDVLEASQSGHGPLHWAATPRSVRHPAKRPICWEDTDFRRFYKVYHSFLLLASSSARSRHEIASETQSRVGISVGCKTKDEVDRVLMQVKQLKVANQVDRAIDVVFEKTDAYFCNSDWESCREILKTANVEELGADLIVSFLVSTLPAKTELGDSRTEFFARAVSFLLRHHSEGEVSEIISGLE